MGPKKNKQIEEELDEEFVEIRLSDIKEQIQNNQKKELKAKAKDRKRKSAVLSKYEQELNKEEELTKEDLNELIQETIVVNKKPIKHKKLKEFRDEDFILQVEDEEETPKIVNEKNYLNQVALKDRYLLRNKRSNFMKIF